MGKRREIEISTVVYIYEKAVKKCNFFALRIHAGLTEKRGGVFSTHKKTHIFKFSRAREKLSELSFVSISRLLLRNLMHMKFSTALESLYVPSVCG